MNSVDKLKGVISEGKGLARANLFRIVLPSRIGGSKLPIFGELLNRAIVAGTGALQSEDINMLCTAQNIPGRAIQMHDYQIGLPRKRVAYGFSIEDVTLAFRVPNDYRIKDYFDQWQDKAVGRNYELRFYKDYTEDVQLQALTKSPSVDYDRLLKLSYAGLDNGSVAQVLFGGDAVTYTINLRQAYPSSVQAIEYSDNNQEMIQLNVQLSYKDWERRLSNRGDLRRDLKTTAVRFLLGGNFSL